ncbi:transglutaminase family protein [Natronohydrobacter thiooxidans]|jgi:transglutaminase-like putative cysteine protease|uniref:transglutaminase family protein n=1 Tax=Natronohydrobacter thiooxidans TaxID=87172 RepID=UPI0008FF1C79|nr:transglutaminase family protein [Natronohydrobacter thiooxidans]
MILTVLHKTRYEFAAPVGGIIQSLRLTPAKSESQRVLDWSVEVPGAVLGTPLRDGAGDYVQTVSVRAPSTQIEVTVSGTVETTDTAGILRGHRERVPPRAYLRNTVRTEPNRAISDMVSEALKAQEDASELERAHLLAAAVAEAVAYQPGTTTAHTTAAEAMTAGAGVCQDHAHVLIACAHLAGLPARYVAGYLNATEDGAPHEASHAWAELYIAGLGWVGFDAANKCCPNEQYIRLGSGLDAQDAAPIRGLVLGGSEEELAVSVLVAPQGQSQQQ